ncbi:MAG: NAD(+) kinase, partial [Giesbergeria sp.]
MKLHFRHVALVGKYQYPAASTAACGSRKVLDDIAHFLHAQGCEVALEAQTAATSGLTQYDTLDAEAIGKQCDL